MSTYDPPLVSVSGLRFSQCRRSRMQFLADASVGIITAFSVAVACKAALGCLVVKMTCNPFSALPARLICDFPFVCKGVPHPPALWH